MFCSDHGVSSEKVSIFAPETTISVAKAALAGCAGINAFAKTVGCDVEVIDVGMRRGNIDLRGVNNLAVREGTANIIYGPAMTREEAKLSIVSGANAHRSAVARGYKATIIGEVGNSNTTAASALLSSLTGFAAEDVVGRGTGAEGVMLERKVSVVKQALRVNSPMIDDPIDCLAKVGGFELGAMAGAAISAANCGVPCIVDGFISTISALLALRLAPDIWPSLVFSHRSDEKGHKMVLDLLEVEPLLALSLRLGEGTGGLACLPLLDLACSLIHGISTFDEAGIDSPYKESSI